MGCLYCYHIQTNFHLGQKLKETATDMLTSQAYFVLNKGNWAQNVCINQYCCRISKQSITQASDTSNCLFS
jgi:hypothetical protein